MNFRHGELVEVPPPKFKHSIIQRRMVQLITPVCPPGAFVTTECGFRAIPEHEYRTADVVYISPARYAAAKGLDYRHPTRRQRCGSGQRFASRTVALGF
jgi:Uma2 family endonuclease